MVKLQVWPGCWGRYMCGRLGLRPQTSSPLKKADCRMKPLTSAPKWNCSELTVFRARQEKVSWQKSWHHSSTFFTWLAACLFNSTHAVKNKASREGRMQRTARKEKVTPVLCLRGVTGLWLGEGGGKEGTLGGMAPALLGDQLTVVWLVSAEECRTTPTAPKSVNQCNKRPSTL